LIFIAIIVIYADRELNAHADQRQTLQGLKTRWFFKGAAVRVRSMNNLSVCTMLPSEKNFLQQCRRHTPWFRLAALFDFQSREVILRWIQVRVPE
jgi:hypothetical protein